MRTGERGGRAAPQADVPRSPTPVLLVDDDPWTRLGAAAAMDADPGLVVHACSIEQALRDGVDRSIEVLVIDVAHPRGPDGYEGVRVVQQACAAGEGRLRRIVALARSDADDLLAVRVAEAGADVLWHWDELDEQGLLEAVRGGRSRPQLDVAGLKRAHGLDPGGRVNDFVAWLVDQGLVHVFAPGTTQQGSGLPRRRSMAVRRQAADVAGLRTCATVGTAALQTPSWREVRRFVQRAVGQVVDEVPDVQGVLADAPSEPSR